MAVRPALESDASAIANLSEQLGYSWKTSALLGRLSNALASAEHAVFVFDHEKGGVVGWVHVLYAHRIESPPFAEIGGLVVAKEFRRRGIDRALVSTAEAWARREGLAKLRVRCNELREDAITFYEQAGFEQVKTQSVLDRSLGPSADRLAKEHG